MIDSRMSLINFEMSWFWGKFATKFPQLLKFAYSPFIVIFLIAILVLNNKMSQILIVTAQLN
jgi:hypothetical protein